ncbi:MAG: hypothetical protein MJ124_03775 [Lachnospiraceae bacterium]|nr:hypothetical protein [Lachnospiraceae bacterium]
MKSGVYLNQKKDGTTLYRASITVKDKHISLGSYKTEAFAHSAYLRAKQILSCKKTLRAYINEFQDGKKSALPFEKVIMLVNLRDNGVYIKTPIYLEKHSFTYYYSPEQHFIFDVDDLFYYSNHKIMKRGSHLFVADYGMQVSILSRYGVKPFAVPGRDYIFVNGDESDFRYGNIEIINHYNGVAKEIIKGRERYTAKIHVNGDIIIGRYNTEVEAAVAYNKAISLLKQKGVEIEYRENYIEGLSELEYVAMYNRLRISSKIRFFGENQD